LHLFSQTGTLVAEQLRLNMHMVWDTVHISWQEVSVHYDRTPFPIPTEVTIPLWDKIRVRSILDPKHQKHLLPIGEALRVELRVKQADTWYKLSIDPGPLSTRQAIQEELQNLAHKWKSSINLHALTNSASETIDSSE
jgi:hypothetical protein